MGIVIILGFVFLAAEVVRRIMVSVAEQEPPLAETAPDAPVQRVGLGLPPGSRIAGSAATDSRVVLHIARPDGGDEVHLIDPLTGRSVLILDPMLPQGRPAD